MSMLSADLVVTWQWRHLV